MRVAITCPYSLSLFGGVQLQVLGLAHELRQLGIDARVLAPSDGPPPAPGIISLGPTRPFPSNGSIAPITSSKAVASRALEGLRAFGPDVLHLHEPLQAGANHAALIGTQLPAVGTFHAAFPGRNGWYDAFRLPLRKMVERLTVRTAVSEEAQRNVQAFGAECEILPNGVDVDAFATADPWPTARPAIFFVGRHEPRKGLGVLLDAFDGLDRDAVLWVGGQGPDTELLRRARERGRRVARRPARGREGPPAARRDGRLLPVDRGGVVRHRAARGDGRGHAAGRVRSHRLPQRRARRAARPCCSRPATPTHSGPRSAACSTTASCAARSWRAGRERAAEFSMRHLAESFIERYELARQRAGVAGARHHVTDAPTLALGLAAAIREAALPASAPTAAERRPVGHRVAMRPSRSTMSPKP